jgi:hypothetical protein
VDQEYTLSSNIYNLTGISEPTLSVPLFKLNNVRVESNLTSVTILWDPAAWATRGFKIYREDGADYILINSPVRGATSYTDTIAAGVYKYKITGVYGSPETEGEPVFITAISGIVAPQNVTAVTAADHSYPFRTTVSWDPVGSAEGYQIYRNGSLFDYTSETAYSDTSTKTIGGTYTYSVVAYNSTYGVTSAESATATVSFSVTDNLTLGQTYYGSLDVQGEFDLYRFDVPFDGNYYLSLQDDQSFPNAGFADAYLYVYDEWGNNIGNAIDVGTDSYDFNSGYTVFVVVVAYSPFYPTTGDYRITLYQ